MNPHTEYRRRLEAGLDELWVKLDREPCNVDLQDVIDLLQTLLTDTIAKEEQWESGW